MTTTPKEVPLGKTKQKKFAERLIDDILTRAREMHVPDLRTKHIKVFCEVKKIEIDTSYSNYLLLKDVIPEGWHVERKR